MNAQHYTHLVQIKFNDDPGVYYNGYFDLLSAHEDRDWIEEKLIEQGHDVKSVKVMKAKQ